MRVRRARPLRRRTAVVRVTSVLCPVVLGRGVGRLSVSGLRLAVALLRTVGFLAADVVVASADGGGRLRAGRRGFMRGGLVFGLAFGGLGSLLGRTVAVAVPGLGSGFGLGFRFGFGFVLGGFGLLLGFLFDLGGFVFGLVLDLVGLVFGFAGFVVGLLLDLPSFLLGLILLADLSPCRSHVLHVGWHSLHVASDLDVLLPQFRYPRHDGKILHPIATSMYCG